jgi:hypothetical protein
MGLLLVPCQAIRALPTRILCSYPFRRKASGKVPKYDRILVHVADSR